jgi:hypothetical protein
VNAPLSLRGNIVIQAQFAIDLFQSELDRIVIQLRLRDACSRDRRGQSGNFGLGIAPAAPPFSGGIRISCKIGGYAWGKRLRVSIKVSVSVIVMCNANEGSKSHGCGQCQRVPIRRRRQRDKTWTTSYEQ